MTLMRLLTQFVYPAHCMQCGCWIEAHRPMLCEGCSPLIELLEPGGRCPSCFSSTKWHLQGCGGAISKIAAACEHESVAATIVFGLKYGRKPFLASGAGSILYLQYLRLGWERPDYIVPVPSSKAHLIMRGYNQALLLAQELSKLTCIPVAELLVGPTFSSPQTGFSREERLALEEETVQLALSGISLAGKHLLLIDDVVTTGRTLEICASRLKNAGAATISALTFTLSE